ncbi:CheF family chemotaxis protein [Halobellus clavatus]|jgi:helix-turn-helix protein|uniref:HTH domain-containing protein n=1 Tax=Halobellus clavatus TaxID=660517 RepID=A0A1H3CGT6_9EURY|nr:CheF family chemotaxis protein [Halobellus clavatus]SDX53296.1 HTH domain-containing protein [Halobellus clavatus]
MTAAGSGGENGGEERPDSGTEHGDVAEQRSELLEAYRKQNSKDGQSDAGSAKGSGGSKSRSNGKSKSKQRPKADDGESIIVDFIANFVAGGDAAFDPVKGRVLMSERRLVLATSETRTTVPIASIFDIAVGQVPPEVEEFFDYTVMVGYIDGDYRRTTVIGGDRELIEKFSLLLFRATLNGSTALVTHPAKVGGRVMDTPTRKTGLHLDYESVTFTGGNIKTEQEEPFSIDLASVIFFEVMERSTDDGETLLVLSVQHVENGQTVTSEISMTSRRKMNILGRYLRLIYHWIKSDVRDVEVEEHELEVLVGLYSTAEDIDLASLLDIDTAELEARLESLHEDDLITDEETPVDLTPQGRFIVNEEFEDINV